MAKDWCETIRASQVIPVYPLTADLQPGDVFLVQQTVSEQHKIYQESGFLPLPFKIARIDPQGYPEHYNTTNAALARTDIPLTIGAGRADPANTVPLHQAPTAAFPSYSFQVQNGVAFDLAIPVSGVPVGLSALGGSGAAATVSIKDARTYGVDAYSIDRDVRAWASSPEHKRFLHKMVNTSGGDPVYLRVVSRVYLAHKFTISLTRRASRSAGASAGFASPAEMVSTAPSDDPATAAAEDYEANLASLNNSISGSMEQLSGGAKVGGSLRFVAASASAVSMQESFTEPLVVGYLGFDMRVREGGDLGPPIPTFQVIEMKDEPLDVAFIGAFTGAESRYLFLFDIASTPIDQKAVFADAAQLLGDDMKALYEGELAAHGDPTESWNAVLSAQLDGVDEEDQREAVYDALGNALKQAIQDNQ